ncbi:DUF2971 domain-containing protein [Roseivirga pacifica]|uniref:DUF2971 domain-containing protein n=1 Tax=Roseivirga pacifica TaxID=1267423 RepID=UPI003BB136AD
MIFHYTSIENLALILESKKIRFNRLDNVDDVLESSEYKELNFSKYLFVSCWTENPEENIALWNMYTHNMKGVRIGLSNPPFRMKLVNEKSDSPIPIIGEKFLPLTIQECFGKDYFIFPFFSNSEMFYKHIEYLNREELEERFKKIVTINKNSDDTQTASVIVRDLAKLKHERWNFQEESRFVLLITHPLKSPFNTHEMIQQLFIEKTLPFSSFDLELDETLFKNMEIVLGPNCSQAEKLIVKALAEKYGIKQPVKESALKDKIRFKGGAN